MGDSIPLLACLRFLVLEHFNVIEHVLPCFISCPVGSVPNAFALEQVSMA